MSKLLLDTNILLDIIHTERPESDEAFEVVRLCNGGGDIGFMSSLSLKDVYYVLSKYDGERLARRYVLDLMGLFAIVPVGAEECDIAIHSNEPDFEDGLVRAAAELEGIDFILTRDKDAFRGSRVRSLTCAEYLDEVRAN